MQNWDLTELIRKYSNSIVSQDVLIAQKLKGISELASKCKGDEYVFANEIIAEFCRVINFIEKQNENTENSLESINNQRMFVAREKEQSPYHNGTQLLNEFEHFFSQTNEYSTVLDYRARINTFANRYLWELYPDGVNYDPILFVYENIEFILAKFKTKDQEGKTVKQRLNIRSALRKLNEFKCNNK